MKKIAIIPARGGSKRIPKKNIKDFLGKPIIAYSIEAAINSELFDEVMVSTDDKDIAEVARKRGAIIPFIRSNKNSDDNATTADVLLEVLMDYKNIGREFDYLCCIYPTAPFITVKRLNDSFKLMISEKTDSVIPIVKFSYPIQRAFRISPSEKLQYIWPENINKRSQDLEPAYHDAGQFYWREVKSFLKNNSLVSPSTVPFIMSEMEVQDIDNEEDIEVAKIKYLNKSFKSDLKGSKRLN